MAMDQEGASAHNVPDTGRRHLRAGLDSLPSVFSDETVVMAPQAAGGGEDSAATAGETQVWTPPAQADGTQLAHEPLVPQAPLPVPEDRNSAMGSRKARRAASREHQQDPGVPGEGKSRRPGRAVLAFVLVVLVVAGIVAAAGYGAELWGGKTIPHVMGLTEARAIATLEEKGFVVQVTREASDKTEGTVIDVSPAAGERAEAGSTVYITVAESRTIPQVVGLSLDDARALLEDAGVENLSITYVSSDAAEGTVVSVSPEEGSRFSSGDTVTVTVAQSFTVPYVVGMAEADAVQAVEDAGLAAEVEYVDSDKDAGQVVGASPAPGTKIGEGATVTLQVSSPYPSDYHYLREYFDCATHLSDYLEQEGFSLVSSYADENNRAHALYRSSSKGNITFSAMPFTHNFAESGAAGYDALADGASIAAIRLDFAPGDIPRIASAINDEAVLEIAEMCGFSDMSEFITEEEAVLPAGVGATEDGEEDGEEAVSPLFACGYGEMGDYCWTVLIVNDGSLRVAVTCAPKGLYNEYDLSKYGYSICNMAAVKDIYE